MHKAFGFLLEVLLAYVVVQYVLAYLGISIPSKMWLAVFLIIWLTTGHLAKKSLRYQGLLSNWYAPFCRVNERNLGLSLFLITIFCLYKLETLINSDLLYTLLFFNLINLITSNLVTPNLNKPYLTYIYLFSCVQIYFITNQFLYLTHNNFELKNLAHQALLLLASIAITQVNYLFLRNFIFYQRLIIDIEQPLTYHEKLIIAVHEASHLLMYTYFKNLPHNINVALFNEAKKIRSDAQGLVTAQIPLYNTKEFLEWRMMLALSGIRGELMIFNNHSHGSESDFEQWRDLAHTYLVKFYPKYNPQPQTTKDKNINQNLEIQIYENQIATIDKFLKLNKKILLKIAKQSLVYNKLNYLQIYILLKKVKKIKLMPREQ